MFNLKNRSFTKLLDYTKEEINFLLDLSKNLKNQKYNGVVDQPLKGKSVALLFQKDSTRTRCAFEVAAGELGMHTVYLGPSGSQFGKKESIEDSAKVLGRMFDGIQFRGYKQEDVEGLAKHAGVPVWNGLTDDWHPTQMIADFLTFKEHKGNLKGLKLVYVGDARNNVAHSLMVTAAKLGVNFVSLAPKTLQTDPELTLKCQEIASKEGSTVEGFSIEEADKALANADAIYTDVWVSMGETDWKGRLEELAPYQVNMSLMNKAKKDAIFLHCLPAFHGLDTTIGIEKAKIYGKEFPNVANGEFEVTNEVISSDHSVVFDEAENRLHTIKAIMLSTIGQ